MTPDAPVMTPFAGQEALITAHDNPFRAQEQSLPESFMEPTTLPLGGGEGGGEADEEDFLSQMQADMTYNSQEFTKVCVLV
jgi:hypothetical protein